MQFGLFQCLALWPGFPRSGATIAGGLLLGTSHRASAEFSFLLAIPMMVAASGLNMMGMMGTGEEPLGRMIEMMNRMQMQGAGCMM